MRTLLIPAAGRDLVRGAPRWLLRHPCNGRYLIRECVRNLDLAEFDRIIVTVLQEADEQYGAVQAITASYSEWPQLEVLLIDDSLHGPAETLYETINRQCVEGAVVIQDSDVCAAIGDCQSENFVGGLSLSDIEGEVTAIGRKSFITVNEQDQVLDVIEKRVRSDLICAGSWGFEDVSDFVGAFEHLTDPAYGIGVIYVSHIVAYLIGAFGTVFHCVRVSDYESWETPTDLMAAQRRYATYFIDFDEVVLPGHLAAKNAIKGELPISAETLQVVERLSRRGARIVFFTAMPPDSAELINMAIRDYAIELAATVFSCTYGPKAVIRSAEDLLAGGVRLEGMR